MADSPQRTWLDVCNEIADVFKEQGLIIRNRVTGVTVKTGDDIFNFSSRGELFHIFEWWEWMCPGHDIHTGKPKGPYGRP